MRTIVRSSFSELPLGSKISMGGGGNCEKKKTRGERDKIIYKSRLYAGFQVYRPHEDRAFSHYGGRGMSDCESKPT